METLLVITTVQWYGIVLIVVGLALRYIVGRNRFYRRNQTGLQTYENYNKSLAIPLFERLLKVLGTLLLLGGLFLFAMELYNKRTAEKLRKEDLKEQQK